MKNVLVLDNYDSFVYNLVYLLKELGANVDVFRNDKISLEEVGKYDQILLSPGPGIPSEAGIMMDLLKEYISDALAQEIARHDKELREKIIEEFKFVNLVYKNCMKLPEFQKAHPFKQVDTPEELRT